MNGVERTGRHQGACDLRARDLRARDLRARDLRACDWPTTRRRIGSARVKSRRL